MHRAARIIAAGLIAGTLDIGDTIILNHFRGLTPAMIFRFIGSSLLGRQAAAHTHWSVPLGVAIHFGLALGWTALFFLLARRVSALVRRPVLGGLAYGFCVWCFMNYIAVPLTRAPRLPPARGLLLVNSIAAVMVCIGLAASLLLRAFGALPAAPAGRAAAGSSTPRGELD